MYVSGLLALDEQGNVIHEGDVVGQTKQILASLKKVLRAVGLTRRDVVKLTIYLTDIDERAAVGAARGELLRRSTPSEYAR